MTVPYLVGVAGYQTARSSQPRVVFRNGEWMKADFPGGTLISGTYSRDQGNTGDVGVLRAGLLMGKRTSDGLYAPSIIGVTDAAYAGGTSLTVTAVTATELSRRIGSSGTFKIIGPPSTNGVVQEETVTYSAISSPTVTISALTNQYVSGSLVVPNDGSEYPNTIIPDGNGITVLDQDGNATNVDFHAMPIGGILYSSQIINWPSDTSIRAWIVGMMRAQGGSLFQFDHLYLP